MTAASDLVTAFQARYSGHVQRIYSRQDDPANSASVDSTKLTAAAEDAIEEFKFTTGIEFDSSSNLHLMVGCDLMEYFLMVRARQRAKANEFYTANLTTRLTQLRTMRAREVQIDDDGDTYEPTAAPSGIKPDFDYYGDYWIGVTRQDGSGLTPFEETNPF